MAKRLAADDEEKEEEEEVLDADDRSLAKRARLSMSGNMSNEFVGNNGLDEPYEEDEENTHRDGEQADADYEAAHEDRIRGEMQDKGHAKVSGEKAQMGVIQEVELVNFMCHSYLEVKLGPQVNFLTGANGSGKSAILTAITVALGAKANSTGRGSGIKSFVKTGEDMCRVTVKLKNRGPEAYRPDVYGDIIIIERGVHREGNASSYKLKSSLTGKIVSSKREELDKILDHMNIQVDNPINVLSQDAARAFLAKSNASDKYNFFLKGTQLAQLSDEYDLVKTNIDVIRNALVQKDAVLPDMKDAIRRAKEKVDSVQLAGRLQDEMDSLEKQLAWAFVAQQEEEVSETKNKYKEAARILEKAQKKISELEAEEQELVALSNEKEEERRKYLAAEDQPEDQTLAEVEGKLKNIKLQYRQHEATKQEIKADLNRVTQTVKQLQETIQLEEDKIKHGNDGEKQRRQLEIETMQEKINKIKTQFPILNSRLKGLQTRKDELEERIRLKQEDADKCKSEIGHLSSKKEGLIRSRGDGPIGAYGSNLMPLMQAIKQKKWTGQTPIGPLGLYVKLVDPKWQQVIEANLGSSLSSFAVTHQADAAALRALFRQFQNSHRSKFNEENPTVFVFTPDPDKDISAGDLSSKGFQTPLSLLQISDSNVRDLLVDRHNIERIAVEWDRDKAFGTAERLNGIYVWTANPLARISVRGQTRQSLFVTQWKKGGLFVADREGEIEALQSRLNELGLVDRQNVAERKELAKELQQLNQQIREIVDDKLQRLNNALVQHERKLTDVIQANRDEEPPNIAGLQNVLDEETALLTNTQIQLADCDREIARVRAEAVPLQEARDQLRAIKEQKEALMVKIGDDIVEIAQRITKKRSDQRHYEKKLAELEKRVELTLGEFEAAQQQLDAWVEEVVLSHPERAQVDKSVKKLTKEMEACKKRIDEQTRIVGISADDANEQHLNALMAYNSAKQEIQEMKDLEVALLNALQVRGARWNAFRRYIALRAKVTFQEHLARRGFLGKILFNHHDLKLSLRVQTDDLASTTTQSREKNPNQLSGGEKSFSTCALLLSLWDAVGCPIRCLDEFDVFMDAVNRRQTLNMMLEVATASDNTQYVFITPQDMSGVRTGPQVRISKMADPVRLERQGRLDIHPVR
ncbi:DNA repair protein RAD18 (SMC family protein) [Phaffia rhodozyma]|uniref:DNA repair protein RAD18 (SMC family protein) n=1 Tax=Phaffia rhodozyma TaxID=264483 RepID=A0A0F7SS83_PHARH|nr:DNA repair protein RAD18 (SMC family protein) [Phaffia rhodozyma]